MQNIKGVVVGNRTAGMTQLLVTYTTHVLQEEQVLNTFGDCRVSVTVDDKTVNFTVCDPTAGQEEYDRLRPIAYLQTVRALCMCLLSVYFTEKYCLLVLSFCLGCRSIDLSE
jgi:GTPase SAR1 family protein